MYFDSIHFVFASIILVCFRYIVVLLKFLFCILMYFSTLNSGCLYFARLILFFNDFFDEILQVLYDVFTICLRFVHDFFCFFLLFNFFWSVKAKNCYYSTFWSVKTKTVATAEFFDAVKGKNCYY